MTDLNIDCEQQKHPFLDTTSASAPAYEDLKDQMGQLRDMIDHVLSSLAQASKSNTGPDPTTTGDAAGKWSIYILWVYLLKDDIEKTYRNLSTAELGMLINKRIKSVKD